MNALGQALAGHRAELAHPGCDRCGPGCCRHCREYLAIAAAHTAARVIPVGSVAPCSVLSVREVTT